MATILYLHGFLSSPISTKAQLTSKWIRQQRPDVDFICPALSSYPTQIPSSLNELVSQYNSDELFLIGSSMGGFWATYLIEKKLAARAVLVNPAVDPQSRITEFIGVPVKHFYSEEHVNLTERDKASLVANDFPDINQHPNYWVMLQTGDATLDYRMAEKKYAECRMTIEEGGNHSFEGYENYLPDIMKFFGINH